MSELQLLGSNFIQGKPSALGSERLVAVPASGEGTLAPAFAIATFDEIDAAVSAAYAAFDTYSLCGPTKRAEFLEAIADEIEALGDALIERANIETALPLPRLTGERGRTCGQLRMFAKLLREGSWVDARIDLPDPARAVGPKPDLRRMLVPIGPVAVFGASNFPLAFSVAGGDTASALAAGCPVVCKAHPSHPGTSEYVAQAIHAALKKVGLPAGVFSLLHGGVEVGQALVKHPKISAVGFTGSQRAGRALFDLAAARPNPIPVYAEMGSVNPLFVTPGALAERGDALAEGYAASLTLGVGQFCTNPGVIVGVASPAFDSFLKKVAEKLQTVPGGTMLNCGIRDRYVASVESWANHAEVDPISVPHMNGSGVLPALFSTSAKKFLANGELQEEVFGPAAIAIRCDSFAELVQIANELPGQLTTTIHFAESETEDIRWLLPSLVRMAGRIVANGFPTGVEVSTAMVHGGPYPATTDARTTSVGTAAIERFVRPVAFQNLPDTLLPTELKHTNPGIWRSVDGVRTNAE